MPADSPRKTTPKSAIEKRTAEKAKLLRARRKDLGVKTLESDVAPATEKQPVRKTLPPKTPGSKVMSGATTSGASTTQYIVTVDNKTGLATKIERYKEDTGERKELSATEYGQALAYSAALPASTLGSAASSTPFRTAAPAVPGTAADWNMLVQAYVQGMVDFFNQQGGTS